MNLTDAEQQEVNSAFARHFGITLPRGVKISRKLTHQLCRKDANFTTKQMFAMIIGPKLKRSEEETVQLCNEWTDKFTILLHEIEQKRGA